MSVRERRRARIDAHRDLKPDNVDVQNEERPKEPIMSKGTPALTERPDEELDKLIDNPNFGPGYQVIYAITRKTGNNWSGVRTGIRGALIGAKDVARACSELVAGGGVFKIEVSYDAENGNKKRLLTPWLEAFDGPPKVGEPFQSLSLGWDGSESGGDGEWIAVPRPGYTPGQQAPNGSAPSGAFGGGFASGSLPAGGWQQPVRDRSGNILPPPDSLGLPASVRSYPVQDQWLAAQNLWTQRLGFRPSLEPVDIAMKWNDARAQSEERAFAQVARLEERVESQRDRNTIALENERRRNAELDRKIAELERKQEKELAEAKLAAQTAQFNAQLEALKMQMQAPKAEPRSPIADLAPFVPVLGALVTVWGQNQQAQVQAQQNFMMAIMRKDPPPPPPPPPPTLAEQIVPLLGAVTPLLVPVFTQWLKNASPETQLAMREQAQLSGQGMIQMMMEFIKYTNQGDPEPPWWQEPMMNAINMVAGGAQAMMLKAANQPPMLPQEQARPAEQQPVQATVVEDRPKKKPVETPAPNEPRVESGDATPPPIVAPLADLEALLARLGEADPIASQQSLFVMRQISALAAKGELDARLVTHEWASLLFAIHQTQPAPNDPRELAARIADHVEHCRTFSLLPENFAPIFEHPHEALWEFMHRMPLAIVDLERCKAITKAMADEIALRESERKRALSEDDESGESAIDGEDEEGDEDEDDESEEGTG